MGGQNHQPCSGCTKHATVLSKTFSIAQAELLLANAVLEDALIAELYDSSDHARHFAAQIVPHLARSVAYIVETIGMVFTILDVMKVTPFQNVKALEKMDMAEFRSSLVVKGMIVQADDVWNEVERTILTEGFEGMFRVFVEHFELLKRETEDLRVSVESAISARDNGMKMIDALERNDFNLKTRFARLLTSWNIASQMFLYSSLISTETHLRTNNFRSLEAA